MFDPGSSAGGTISSSEHDLETLAALRFGSRFVDRQIHCEICQLYCDRTLGVSGLSGLGIKDVPKCQILETTTRPRISNLSALPYFRTGLKPPT